MKRLTITYNNAVIFDQDVSEFTWTDSDSAVSVSGKIRPSRQAGSGLFDALVSASKRQTQQVTNEYRNSAEDQ